MIITAILIGLALAAGLMIILRLSVFPPRVSMEKVLSERQVLVEKGQEIQAGTNRSLKELYSATSRRLEGQLDFHSKAGLQLKRDLSLIGRTPKRHVEHKMVAAMFGALVGVLAGLIIIQAPINIPLPIGLVIALALMFGLLGIFIPDSLVKTKAQTARKEFDEMVLSWLDLVVPLIASGRDVSAAFIEATVLSRCWPFQMLGQHMSEARHLGKPIWTGLRKMVDEKGLDRLEQFCSALELSQRSGAELRQTVLAQVHSYRQKAHTDAVVKSEGAQERMGAPLALSLAAFFLLIAYPAIALLVENIDSFDIPTDSVNNPTSDVEE